MANDWLMHGKKPSPFASILGQLWRAPEVPRGSPEAQLHLHFLFLPQSSPSLLTFLWVYLLKTSPVTPLHATLLLRAHFQESQSMIHDKLPHKRFLRCLQSRRLELESSGQLFSSLSSLPCIFSAWLLPDKPGFPWPLVVLMPSQNIFSTSSSTANSLILWVFLHQFLQESVWLAQLTFSSQATS